MLNRSRGKTFKVYTLEENLVDENWFKLKPTQPTDSSIKSKWCQNTINIHTDEDDQVCFKPLNYIKELKGSASIWLKNFHLVCFRNHDVISKHYGVFKFVWRYFNLNPLDRA